MQDLEPHLKRGRDGGVSRPKELQGSLVGCEEEFGMGFRPEEVGLEGVWLFKGPALQSPELGHQRGLSFGKEREGRDDKGLFGGASREALLLETLAVFDRVAITDKALLGKASRYNDSPSIFVGGVL